MLSEKSHRLKLFPSPKRCLLEIDKELYREIFTELWFKLEKIRKRLEAEGINPLPSMAEMINSVLKMACQFNEADLEMIIREVMKDDS